MEIIPAIDLKDSLCVRLYQGDFDRTTVYDEDPVAVAQRWVVQGATRLHIVDLDGAKAGHPVNTDIVRDIVQAVDIPVQLGGGMRCEEDIAAVLEMGVSRVILGTAAVNEPALVERMVQRFGSSIIIGVDARDGYVAIDGWTEATFLRATDLIDQMADIGVQRIIYTDISRDGTLTEPNYAATSALISPGGPAIIASGGISHHDHLLQLARLGVEGAIVGRALYTEAIDLATAIDALRM
jgi:phosphoribosylformimino-5-aminoimidazole carboxamide ribotide isomerase